MGDGDLDQHSDEVTVEELRGELEDLRTLVHTLLTIIMEEAEGVQSGNTPQIPNQPKRGYSMLFNILRVLGLLISKYTKRP